LARLKQIRIFVQHWIKAHRAPVIAVGFWLVLLLLARQYMQVNNLTFGAVADQLKVLLTESAFGPLLYMGIYLLRPLTLVPAIILTILGGSVFGVWPGFLYVLVAGTLSSIIPYAVGRWFSNGQSDQFTHNATILRFVGALKRHPFQSMLIIRLLFLPYDGVSLAAGGLRIPFGIFFLATALGNLSGTFSYVGLGASIQSDLTTGDIILNPTTLLASMVILISSLVFSRLLNTYQNRRHITGQERAE
jgi:uncharacterized membrane protein YdjX (TVP38/TMEM64 family)